MSVQSNIFSLKLKTYKIYRQLVRFKEFHSRNLFEKRILRRLKRFYDDKEDISFMYKNYGSKMSMEKWKQEKYWQMKLENKLNAKEFAIKNNCKVAKLYWKGNVDEIESLNFETLPSHFTIKPNLGHSSMDIFLMSDGYNFFDSKYYSLNELKAEVLKCYQKKKGIQILIEEFLTNSNGEYRMTWDYKFYAFNGEVALVQVNEKDQKNKRLSYYDANWKPIKRKVVRSEIMGDPVSRPIHFEDMLEDVRKLSRQYRIFARIDFYDTARGAVFGEFTPTPRRGKDFTFYASKLFIKYWDTYCKGMI